MNVPSLPNYLFSLPYLWEYLSSLIEKLFVDIVAGKDLSSFKIAKEVQKGIGSAIVDALILEPNISGIGVSFKKLGSFLRNSK